MRCAIYARRSSEEHQEASLEVQVGEAAKYIARKGWELLPDHVYQDNSVSRAEFKKRPGLIVLLNAAARRAFDVVVVRDETRIGGDTYRSGIVMQDLLDAGARLFYYFTDEEVKLDDAIDKFLVAARNFASELEREKIAQRTREHLLVKARLGLNTGGRVYGYDNKELREGERRVGVDYEVNAAEAEIVREVFRRYALGDGLRTIAKRLNGRGVPSPRAGRRGTGSWAPSQIRSMLLNERFCGRLVWGRVGHAYRGGTRVSLRQAQATHTVAERPDLRIVDDDLWGAVQRRFSTARGPDRHRAGTIGPAPRYLLSGLARCATCGGPIGVASGKIGKRVGQRVYGCAWHRNRGDSVCGNTLRRPVEEVDAAVLDAIRQDVLREELVVETLRQVRLRLADRAKAAMTDAPELEREARKLRAELDRLVQALASTDEKPGVVVHAIADREKQLAALNARLVAIRTAPSVVELEVRRLEREARDRLRQFRRLFEENPAEGRKALEALVDGPLRFTPVETDEGKRYQIEGTVALGNVFTTDCDPTGI